MARAGTGQSNSEILASAQPQPRLNFLRMRHVADIAHPAVKITLLAWNGKFLLKLEQGNLEQTYKVAELDLVTGSDAEVRELLDEEFLNAAIARFEAMRTDLQAAFARQELR
jgi:phage repressor protein C with HTH and peptisase S24 domain